MIVYEGGARALNCLLYLGHSYIPWWSAQESLCSGFLPIYLWTHRDTWSVHGAEIESAGSDAAQLKKRTFVSWGINLLVSHLFIYITVLQLKEHFPHSLDKATHNSPFSTRCVLYIRLCSLYCWQQGIYSCDWRRGQCSVGCHHGTILCKSRIHHDQTRLNTQQDSRMTTEYWTGLSLPCSSVLGQVVLYILSKKPYLKVMTSKLPVWSRASITARSLASEPLLVRYTTLTGDTERGYNLSLTQNKGEEDNRSTFRGSGRLEASFSQYSWRVG